MVIKSNCGPISYRFRYHMLSSIGLNTNSIGYVDLQNFQAQDKLQLGPKPKISRDLSRKNTKPAAGRENCG